MALQPPRAAASTSTPIIRASGTRKVVVMSRMKDSPMTAVDVVIMAAGQGTRMKSRLPKVLHRLGGRPLAQHVIDTVAQLDARSVIVITGHGAEQVEQSLAASAKAAGRPAP